MTAIWLSSQVSWIGASCRKPAIATLGDWRWRNVNQWPHCERSDAIWRESCPWPMGLRVALRAPRNDRLYRINACNLLQKNRENEMKIRRRSVLLGATGAALAAGSLPAPAIAQGIRELNMVTSWPANFFPYGISADRLAQSIGAMSDGRLKVKVFPADKL